MKQDNLLQDLGCLFIRVMIGVVFVFHGGQKLFGFFDGAGLVGFAKYLETTIQVPYPAYAAVLAGGAEFLGGLALITGVGMRIMIIPLVVTMGVASYMGHAHTFSMQQNGMEYPLTLGVVLIGLLMMGPGRFRVPDFLSGSGSGTLPEIKPIRRRRTRETHTVGNVVVEA